MQRKRKKSRNCRAPTGAHIKHERHRRAQHQQNAPSRPSRRWRHPQRPPRARPPLRDRTPLRGARLRRSCAASRECLAHPSEHGRADPRARPTPHTVTRQPRHGRLRLGQRAPYAVHGGHARAAARTERRESAPTARRPLCAPGRRRAEQHRRCAPAAPFPRRGAPRRQCGPAAALRLLAARPVRSCSRPGPLKRRSRTPHRCCAHLLAACLRYSLRVPSPRAALAPACAATAAAPPSECPPAARCDVQRAAQAAHAACGRRPMCCDGRTCHVAGHGGGGGDDGGGAVGG